MLTNLEIKVSQFVDCVTSDPRWNIQDELLFQVLGHTLYGYAFGIGRVTLFLEPEEINKVVVESLVELGAGRQYVEGMVMSAFETFESDQGNSVYSQLVGIGHSHFANEDLKECVNSIFSNTAKMAAPTPADKPWWKFW